MNIDDILKAEGIPHLDKEKFEKRKEEIKQMSVTITGEEFIHAATEVATLIGINEGIMQSLDFLNNSALLMHLIFDKNKED